jgi:hypothetical protein
VRKIKSNFFISLDGVVESPDKWHFPYFNDEMGAAIGAGAAGVDAYLMGRVLYEEWARSSSAGAWRASSRPTSRRRRSSCCARRRSSPASCTSSMRRRSEARGSVAGISRCSGSPCRARSPLI